jgi:hypothetical protein
MLPRLSETSRESWGKNSSPSSTAKPTVAVTSNSTNILRTLEWEASHSPKEFPRIFGRETSQGKTSRCQEHSPPSFSAKRQPPQAQATRIDPSSLRFLIGKRWPAKKIGRSQSFRQDNRHCPPRLPQICLPNQSIHTCNGLLVWAKKAF